MTLPSNLISTEPSVMPCDPFAMQGLPESTNASGSTGVAPFASVLTQVDATPLNPATGQSVLVAAQPAVNATGLTPNGYYYVIPGAQSEAPDLVSSEPVASPSSFLYTSRTDQKQKPFLQSGKSNNEETSAGAVVLAYEFIAGQWVQQPVAPVEMVEQVPAATLEPEAIPAVSLPTTSGESTAISRGNTPFKSEGKEQARAAASLFEMRAAPSEGPAPTPTPNTQKEGIAQVKSAAQVETAVQVKSVAQVKSAAQSPQLTERSAVRPVAVLGDIAAPSAAPIANLKLEDASTVTDKSNITSAQSFGAPVVDVKNPPVLEKNGADNSTEPRASVESEVDLLPGRQIEAMGAPLRQTLLPARQTSLGTPEKFAASGVPARDELRPGVNPSNQLGEKKTLAADRKGLNLNMLDVGTDTANREVAMPYSATSKPDAVVSLTAGHSVPAGIQAGTTTASSDARAPIAVEAPRLVHEIRAIADRLSVINHNAVEVRFDFSDTDRLSVRVEYRDGTVHTTFRTDSAQLRDAISHEWQGQAATAEQRSYKMADPVFSQANAGRQDLSSQGDNSNRQRAFEQASQTAGAFRSTNFTTQPSAPAIAARVFRPETSLHLHALA